MLPEERGPELFFQLSSADRKRILSELQNENLRLNEIAKRLEMTATETLRQLQRLTEASLIQRRPEGSYSLTEYAELVLQLSSSLEFVSKYKDYFLTHDVKCLPRPFLDQVGVLANGNLTRDDMEGVNNMRKVVQEAKEFAWGATVETFPDHGPVIGKLVSEGVTIRALGRESLLPSRAYQRNPSVEWRASEAVPLNMILNEKEAGVSFCFTGGRVDHVGFYGGNPVFYDWAKELFLYYWDKGKRNPTPKT